MRYRLSIVIPCYRVERYLRRCLNALLAQSLKGIQLVCVNDGSPDGCLKILREYESRYPNIVVIDQENRGVWNARMRGIAAAEGEFIGFADPDDRVCRDSAKKLYAAAKVHRADIAVCGFDRMDEKKGKRLSREMTAFPYRLFSFRKEPGLCLEVNPAVWNKIFRAKLVRSMPDFRHIPRIFDDLFFSQLLFLNADRICFVPESLIRYTVRADSIIRGIREEYVPEVRDAMLELRNICLRKYPERLDYLSALAFLHLGISLLHRISALGDRALKRALRENTAFLDAEFPGWRNNPYLGPAFILSHRGANRKVYFGHWLSRLHLMPLFFRVYNGMISRLGVDFKW